MSLVLAWFQDPAEISATPFPCHTHLAFTETAAVFSPLLFAARTYCSSEHGVLWKSGKSPYAKSLWKCNKIWWKRLLKATWPPWSPAAQMIVPSVCAVELGWGCECSEDHRTLNHSPLGIERVCSETQLSLMVDFCGVSLRRISYTYVPLLVTSPLAIFLCLNPLSYSCGKASSGSSQPGYFNNKKSSNVVNASHSCFGLRKTFQLSTSSGRRKEPPWRAVAGRVCRV